MLDSKALHGSCPVQEAHTKWVAQKWFRHSFHTGEDDTSLLGYWPLTMPIEKRDGALVPVAEIRSAHRGLANYAPHGRMPSFRPTGPDAGLLHTTGLTIQAHSFVAGVEQERVASQRSPDATRVVTRNAR